MHALPRAGPLYHFQRANNTISDSWTGDFFLNSSLYIEDNVLLEVLGEHYGGDVNRWLLVRTSLREAADF